MTGMVLPSNKLRVPQRFSTDLRFTRPSSARSCPDIRYGQTMSSNEDRAPSSTANALYCSGERYRQCSPESCPGLTAQCTDRCVVVTCSNPHDDDHEEVCGEIICDDQSCTDPIDCHGIYEFVSLHPSSPFFLSSFQSAFSFFCLVYSI